MTRVCWWLVEVVSRGLTPDERDAVRGDIAESGESAAHALADVMGLAVRRQAALWIEWRPWVVFAGLIVPLGLLLSFISSGVAARSNIYFWMYFDNCDWALLQQRAFWMILGESISVVVPHILALICLSWTVGLALGTLSRRTLAVNGALFCFVALHGEFALGQELHGNDAMSSLTFYRVVFPPLLLLVLVLIPACLGMFSRLSRATPLLRAILWVPALATMAVFATMQGLWSAGLALRGWGWLGHSWEMPPLLFIFAGPAIYVVAATWRRWGLRRQSI